MIPPADLSALPGPVQRIVAPGGPAPARLGVAKGVLPGLRPEAIVLVVAVLASDADEALASTAKKTLETLAPPILAGALAAELQPVAIDALARAFATRVDVLERLVPSPSIHEDTLTWLAAAGSEAVTELVATNETRLLAHPSIIEKLYLNKNTRMSTADRLIDLAARSGIELHGIGGFREAVAALDEAALVEAGVSTFEDQVFATTGDLADELDVGRDEHTHEHDESGAEVPTKKLLPIHAQLKELSISGRIRRAILGTAAERQILVRDANKLVAAAAVRSPQIQEPEIVRISSSRNTNEEAMRIIGANGEWLKNHQIKYNLVSNPKTPFAVASRLVLHMREHELKQLERSRDVPAPVRQAATQQLKRKGKKD